MPYKSYKGRWQVGGDKPVISILTTGLFCFNKVCYEQFVKPANCKYVRPYYEPEMKKIAFELLTEKTGELVFPITLTKTGRIAVVNGKVFLNHYDIKYQDQARSYPVHPNAAIPETGTGYKRTWSQVKRGLEIRLSEYITL